MRIYIQHVDGYIGRALVRELRKNGPIWNRLFGSFLDAKHSTKPNGVRRVVQVTDKRFVETVLSCKLIVLHLREEGNDEVEQILQLLKTATLEEPISLVLVSSIFVWNAGHDIRGSDAAERQPLTAAMKAYKEYEERVLAFNADEASQIKGHVLACGALYGGGECSHFENIFKDAWLGKTVELPSLLRRTHSVPTVNVFDLGRLVHKLIFSTEAAKGEHAYLICADTARNTLNELWQAIVNEMTEGYTLKVEPSEEDEETSMVGMSDLTCVPSELMTADDFPWIAPGGLTVPANATQAGIQYAKNNNLQPVKLLLVRPEPKPTDPTDKAAETERKAYEAACARYETFLCEEFGLGSIASFSEVISTNTTRYRGYVLKLTGELSAATCRENLLEEVEVEEVIPAPPLEEGEESPGGQEQEVRIVKKMLPKEGTPGHVVALAWPKEENSFVDFFRDTVDTTLLYLPAKPEEVEKQMESLRMYVDGTNKRPDGSIGRALNFNMKPESQVIEEMLLKHEEAAADADHVNVNVDDDNLDEVRKKEMTKAEKARLERLQKLAAKEAELKKPTIAEFVKDVIPTLTEGLIALCKLKPETPVEYLADFLDRGADRLEEGSHA
ncbi:unnamed protein product [Amoebophrya sp. A25]|nr:unnamed protein product [Amoebophrya sp. A25]|eukprot:GSA25T00009832001.1